MQIIYQPIKWRTQLYQTGQWGEFLGRLLGSLLKTGLSLIGSVLKPLSKSVLIPLAITVAAPATNAPTHKEMFGSSTTTLVTYNNISNKE